MSFAALRMWLRALLFRRHVDAEVDREIRLHLDLETEANLRAGMSPAEARRAALVAFGGVERHKESVRDARLTRSLEQVAADLRFAFRGVRKNPGFAVSVAMLLALGIGATAALFGVMYHLLISPLPYPDGDRMARVKGTANGGMFYVTLPRRPIEEWAATTRAAEHVTLLDLGHFALGDTTRATPERVRGAGIAPGALAYVGAHPMRGRDIAPFDTAAGAQPVTLLSHGLWQRLYGASDEALGQVVLLDGRPHVIVGIAPPGFSLPFFEDYDQVFPALRADAQTGLEAIAKIRPGSRQSQANAELAALWTLDRSSTGLVMDAPTLAHAADLVRPAVRNMVYVLMGAVAFVLLIASANVANLLMARAWGRQRELAVRAALGAGRGRLFQQLLVESLVLAMLGGLLALGAAQVSLHVIAAVEPEGIDLALDGTGLQRVVLVATAALAVASGLAFGIGPALFASARQSPEGLKAGSRTVAGSVVARRLRSGLVVAEVALSVVLLTGAGLLVRSLVSMQRADIGMDAAGMNAVSVRLPDDRFPAPEDRRAALTNIVSAVRDIAGVSEATLALTMPPEFAAGVSGFVAEGMDTALPDSMRTIPYNAVLPDFFRVTGIRVRRGRTFAAEETPADRMQATVAVVNETFARRFWPSEEALGRRIRYGEGPWAEIVGIVDDVRIPGRAGTWESLQLYQPMPAAATRASIVVRSALPHTKTIELMTEAIRRANPHVTIGGASSAERQLANSRASHRFMLQLIGIFAGLALLLAGVGLHAVIAYSVGQRSREIGVRVALGAEPGMVMRLVHGQGLVLAVTGIAIGMAGALAASRFLRMLLFGVEPGDPVTMLAVAALLLGTAVVATHVPARRAMRVDPVAVLRNE